MVFSILTLFPDMFAGPFDFSIIKHAKEKGLVKIDPINIRDFATDNYKTVDDRPYGGGVGMILKVDVVDRAIESVKNKFPRTKTKIVLLDPKGKTYTQSKTRELSKTEHLIIICGHYEGVDARVEKLVDESVSIGSYVLTGGEIPAMVIVDSVARLIPGVLAPEASQNESFSDEKLEAPQYTRPEEYKGMKVPQTLLSGHHAKISEWKKRQTGKAPSG